MDKLYTIYKNGKKMKTNSNGYNTEKGARTAITMFIKNSEKELTKEGFQIKTFVPYEEISFLDLIKRMVS